MKWISVKDRLPKEDEDVVFTYSKENGICSDTFFENNVWMITYYDFGAAVSEEKYEHEVTHWMPLPEKPYEMD